VGGNAGTGGALRYADRRLGGQGSRVNAGDPESFGSDYLDQPVDPYRVDQLVEPGELLETGAVSLRVVPVRRALARTGRPLRGALQGPDCG
jgi:hypothetical protein